MMPKRSLIIINLNAEAQRCRVYYKSFTETKRKTSVNSINLKRIKTPCLCVSALKIKYIHKKKRGMPRPYTTDF